MLPKYKYLLTYRYAEIIFDLGTKFCLVYLSDLRNLGNLRGIPTRRTIEQITQALRSGKQNIIEAVSDSLTSKKSEIKLLGIANGSFEEFIADLEDYLRLRGLSIWPKTDPRIAEFRKLGFRLSNLGNLSNLGHLIEKPLLPKDPEEAANLLLTLSHQETYLLSRQIASLEEKFLKEGGTYNFFRNYVPATLKFADLISLRGGYSENLLKKRLEYRNKKSK